MSDLVLYTTEDGRTRIDLRIEGGTVWLTQLEIADLFQTTKHNVSIHTKNIFLDGELTKEATVKESLTVQTEGTREVRRTIQGDIPIPAVRQPKLALASIKSLKVPLPSHDEQVEIARALDLAGCNAEKARAKRDQLQDPFRTLLHELMSAKTCVHDLEISA